MSCSVLFCFAYLFVQVAKVVCAQQKFRSEIGFRNRPLLALPAFFCHTLDVHVALSGLGKTSTIPTCVIRSFVAKCLPETFCDRLKVFADASMNLTVHKTTAADTIPVLDMEHVNRFCLCTKTTTEEPSVLRMALKHISRTQRPCSIIDLSLCQLANEEQAGLIAR